MRYHKLWWHYTQSQDGAQLPAGELGVGKSHLSRHVPLAGLTPWAASDALAPPGPREDRPVGQRAVSRLGHRPEGAGAARGGKEEPPKRGPKSALLWDSTWPDLLPAGQRSGSS